MQKAAVHPTGTAIAGDVLIVLPILNPALILEVFESILVLEQDVLSANVHRLVAAVPFKRLADHEGVAGAVGDIGNLDLGVLKEDAVIIFQGRLGPRAEEVVGGAPVLANGLHRILRIEADF